MTTADEFFRKVADDEAARLASEYAVTGVREDAGRLYVDCYTEELPEDGMPTSEPVRTRTYEVGESGATVLAFARDCRYHPGLPVKDLGLCEACLERYCEAGGR